MTSVKDDRSHVRPAAYHLHGGVHELIEHHTGGSLQLSVGSSQPPSPNHQCGLSLSDRLLISYQSWLQSQIVPVNVKQLKTVALRTAALELFKGPLLDAFNAARMTPTLCNPSANRADRDTNMGNILAPASPLKSRSFWVERASGELILLSPH